MKKKPAKKVAITVLVLPPLNKGEIYAGILIEKGKPTHHLILLPGHETAGIKWDNAVAWAKAEGGELPTRKEAALLFANVAEHFEQRYCWTNEVHTGAADYAWVAHFGNGYQYGARKGGEYRARAVRRVAI